MATSRGKKIIATPIPLTQDEINLITRALRIMSQDTGFLNIRNDSKNLIEHIEKESKKK